MFFFKNLCFYRKTSKFYTDNFYNKYSTYLSKTQEKEQVQRNNGRTKSASISLYLLFIAVTVSFHIRLQNGFVFALWTEP